MLIKKDYNFRLNFLYILFTVYVTFWIYSNGNLLFDIGWQTDDARTSIFPFYQYQQPPRLLNDEIANEMLAFNPPFVRLLYRFIVFYSNIFIATKIVQVICFLILIYASILLFKSKSAGPAIAILMLFIVLHTPFLFVRGIGGGLPRAFAFPLMFLWVSAALTQNTRAQMFSIVAASLTYPTAMLILLGAESIKRILELRNLSFKNIIKVFSPYVFLVLICFVIVLFYLFENKTVGAIHTYKEAFNDPAFYKNGRLPVLPYPNLLKEILKYAALPLLPSGYSIWSENFIILPKGHFGNVLYSIPLLLLSLLMIFKNKKLPLLSISLFISCIILYIASRVFAFKLYSPERYYSFGITLTCIVYIIEVSATYNENFMGFSRNNLVLLLFIFFLLFSGTGITPNHNGMTISVYEHKNMYDLVKKLPSNIKIAAHPLDADDIRFWAGVYATDGFETLQPWFKESWNKQKFRTKELLKALYADNFSTIELFTQKYKITHYLINRRRYESDISTQAKLFEPFTTFTDELLKHVNIQELFFKKEHKNAIIYLDDKYVILDASILFQNESI